MNRKPNVLLIGGSGFIGTRLSLLLLRRQFAVSVLDFAAPSVSGVSWTPCDIRKPLENANLTGFDAVIHLAGLLARGCSENPTAGWDTNVMGLQNVIDALQASKASPRVLFFSSSMVQESSCTHGPELARSCGRCIYRESKRAGERLLEEAGRTFGWDTTLIRPFTVYGPGPAQGKRGHFIASWVEKAAARVPLPIFGTGDQVLDLLHVDDLAELCVSALEQMPVERTRILDAGTGRPVSVSQIARWFKSAIPDVTFEQHPLAPSFCRDVADTHHAQTEFGWSAATNPEDGIATLLRKRFATVCS